MSLLERMNALPVAAQISFAGILVLYLLWAAARFGSLGENSLQSQLGLSAVPGWIFTIFALLWVGLVIVLTGGLYVLIVEVLFYNWLFGPPPREATTLAETNAKWDWRFRLVQITALTTVLGAVIVLPITLTRMRFQREANETAEKTRQLAKESLFNDKFKAASDDLYARREIRRNRETMDGQEMHFIEDDVVRRVAAIDRLEGLASERPDEAPRVARLLCVYLRELSKLIGPSNREHPRADMEAAAQTVGRLKGIEGVAPERIMIDLSGVNLHGFRLVGSNFSSAVFNKANLSGARLSRADLTGAHLGNTIVQNADLSSTVLDGARLFSLNLKGVSLADSSLINAKFAHTKFADSKLLNTDFRGSFFLTSNFTFAEHLNSASFKGAALSHFDPVSVELLKEFHHEIFTDGSIQHESGPGRPRPRHWKRAKLKSLQEFEAKWRAWQRSIGFDPDNPE